MSSSPRRIAGLITAVVVLLACSFVSCVRATATKPVAELKVVFLDVGQADSCILLLPDGTTVLIDAGTKEAGKIIVKRLQELDVERIDRLVLTHPHEDHIGGAVEVMGEFDVGDVFMPRTSHTTKTYEKLLLAIQAMQLPLYEAKAGKVLIDQEDLKATFTGPANAYTDLNEMSAVLSLTYGKVTFLFTGDAGATSEADMLASGLVTRADVLKVGHHGSSTSSTKAFLETVSPDIAVISVGAGNTYGHPAKSTLERLESEKVSVYRTDLDGEITVTSDGATLTVETGKNGN